MNLYSKALKLSRQGKYEKAILEFDKVVSREPRNADALSDRGVAKFHVKDFEGALSDMDQALELEPNNPYRYASRAYIRDKSGDTKGAIEDYKKAIELDPENAVSHNNLGLLEEKQGYIDRAKLRFQLADRLSEDFELEEEIISIQKRDEMVDSLLKDLNISVDDQKDKKEKISLLRQMLMVFSSKEERSDFFGFLKKIFKK